MTRTSHPFDVRARDIWAIAVPASIAFITEPLAGLVDITVIGRQGDAAMLGGVVLAALAFDFIFSLAYFLRIGTAGLTAQAVGARDPRDGLLHALRAIVIGIVAGGLMIVLQGPLLWLTDLAMAPTPGVATSLGEYFAVRIWSAPFSLVNFALLGWFYGRARAKTGMSLQMLMHGIDIPLSILFVMSFGGGPAGAAFATVLGQMVACGAGLVLLVRHFGGIAAVTTALRSAEMGDVPALRRMFSLSRDLMIRSIALMIAFGWFAAQGSRLGEVELSANAILLNFLMIAAFFLDGIAQAAEQLSGKAIGANWRPAFDGAYRLSFVQGLLIALLLTLLGFVGGWVLIDFMTTNEAVRDYARGFLWLAALSPLTGMPAFVFDGILVGATLNRTMRNGMLAAMALFLLLVSVLQPAFGNVGLWLSLHAFFVARALYYFVALERQRPGLFAAS